MDKDKKMKYEQNKNINKTQTEIMELENLKKKLNRKIFQKYSLEDKKN